MWDYLCIVHLLIVLLAFHTHIKNGVDFWPPANQGTLGAHFSQSAHKHNIDGSSRMLSA